MPELITCPSCGCGVQALDLSAGTTTRCPGCRHVFTLEAGRSPAPGTPGTLVYRLRDVPVEATPERGRMPLCPGCHHPVGTREDDCPHCGYRFAAGAVRFGPRRDCLPHRGGLIHLLGIVSLYAGVLAIVSGPAGLMASLAAGLPAVQLARHDLAGMRTGDIDPAGRGDTEAGKEKAVTGMALGVVLGVPLTLWLAQRWM